MLSGKQKRFLRAMGSGLDPIIQVGKSGISENLIHQVNDALEARELIKIRVLNNSPADAEQIAYEISAYSGADIVQVIGHNILLYRPSKEKPQICLP